MWMIGFLGTVLLVVVVLGVTALYYGAAGDEVVTKMIKGEPHDIGLLRKQQEAQLQLTAWEDRPPAQPGGARAKALVIPIEDAKEIVAREMGGKRK